MFLFVRNGLMGGGEAERGFSTSLEIL